MPDTEASELSNFKDNWERKLKLRAYDHASTEAYALRELVDALLSDLQRLEERVKKVEEYQRGIQEGAAELRKTWQKRDSTRLEVNPKSHTYQDDGRDMLSDRGI